MRFHENISVEDHDRVLRAIKDIKKHGDEQHAETAEFLERSDALLFIGPANEVGGSGSVGIYEAKAALKAIRAGDVTAFEAAKYIRMNLARETIDTGGQRGIEGTFVHEGKHLRDFALMIETLSRGDKKKVFDPTAFHLEHSAHITSAFYMMRRGGEFVEEGVSLGLLEQNGSDISVSKQGILDRLKNNYGLSEETPGPRLSERCTPALKLRRKKILGII
jgi:hypothetical protein